MKVYNYKTNNNQCYSRIIDALVKYAPPNISFTTNIEEADLAILHVNGRLKHMTKVANQVGKYIVIQYCLRSTMNPNVNDWKNLWDNAQFIWSYYDLPTEIIKDGLDWQIKNFYHAPLGADPVMFDMIPISKKHYTILTFGDIHSLKGESINDIIKAINKFKGCMYHVGDILEKNNRVIQGKNISDIDLVNIYKSCRYVSGLRKIEGFELPIVEGIFCGIRPIVFDTKNYRQWYEPWAEFILEDKYIVDSLVNIFEKEYKPISKKDRDMAVDVFNWSTIIKKFWERI